MATVGLFHGHTSTAYLHRSVFSGTSRVKPNELRLGPTPPTVGDREISVRPLSGVYSLS